MPTFSLTSLTALRQRRPLDHQRWANGGALSAAVGFSTIAMVSCLGEGRSPAAHSWLLFGTALACWTAYILARSGRGYAGTIIAVTALWFEIHTSLVIAPTFPSPGVVAAPLLVIAAALIFGMRVGYLAAVGSIVMTALAVQFSPAFNERAFGRADAYWLAVLAVVLMGTAALVSLTLQALRSLVRSVEEREQDLRALIAEAPDGILVVSTDARVQVANPAARRILAAVETDEMDGVPDGLEGRALADVLAHAGAADPLPLVATLLTASDHLERPTLEWRLKGGTRGDVQVEVTRQKTSGGRWQLMLRDVSERALEEFRLRESKSRAEHAQRLEAVGRLAGGIAHDFNNLLVAIGGNAELLRHEADAAVRETLIDEMLGAHERGASLTRQLLAFARRDSVAPTVLDLSAIVRNMQRLLQRVAGDAVQLDCLADTPAHVLVDSIQMEQILMNLVANARDAMPAGGTCRIIVRTVGPVDALDGVTLTVADEGVGMDDATVARACEPFFTTKARGRGTGLGLATTHGIITRFGGQMHIHSVPNDGTTIVLTLPRRDVPDESAEVPSPPDVPSAGRGTILVAEDDDSTRAVVGRILQRAGYDLVLALDGAQAERFVRATPGRFDMLVTDVLMPGRSGPELALAVWQERPDLPVLFITGNPEGTLEALPDLDLARDVLPKPFGSDELLRRVASKLLGSPA